MILRLYVPSGSLAEDPEVLKRRVLQGPLSGDPAGTKKMLNLVRNLNRTIMPLHNLIKIKLISCLLFFIPCSYACAQTVQMDDLLKAYSLDSISLRTFLHQKGFHIETSRDEDSYRVSYTYYADSTRTGAYIDRTFPKISKNLVFLYYHFSDPNEYKYFKKTVKANGFKFNKSYEAFPNSKISDFREQYTRGDMNLELSSSGSGKNKMYVLLLLPK
jgi:hypothetical protein